MINKHYYVSFIIMAQCILKHAEVILIIFTHDYIIISSSFCSSSVMINSFLSLSILRNHVDIFLCILKHHGINLSVFMHDYILCILKNDGMNFKHYMILCSVSSSVLI